MPYLSFAETKGAVPIAIVRGDSQNGKVVYLSDNKPTSNQHIDVDYFEVSKKLKGIKYTGSKVLSSAIAMDKIMSKILFEEYHITKLNTIYEQSQNVQKRNVTELLITNF